MWQELVWSSTYFNLFDRAFISWNSSLVCAVLRRFRCNSGCWHYICQCICISTRLGLAAKMTLEIESYLVLAARVNAMQSFHCQLPVEGSRTQRLNVMARGVKRKGGEGQSSALCIRNVRRGLGNVQILDNPTRRQRRESLNNSDNGLGSTTDVSMVHFNRDTKSTTVI